MQQQLVVVHRQKPDVFTEVPSGWRIFETCLRSIAISFVKNEFPAMKSTDRQYTDEAAYGLLVDIACGLQSPVAGETEVFGQFRQFADGWSGQEAFFQKIYTDIKSVRQAHLSHLGSQSYGSWVRKRIDAKKPVHIVGSGQLAREIGIWLKKSKTPVKFYSRCPDEARLRLSAHIANVDVATFSAKSPAACAGETLIIAAPFAAKDVRGWLSGAIPALTIDLRSDSSEDKFEIGQDIERLSDVFNKIETGRSRAEEKIRLARQMIRDIVGRRFQSETLRPFGWDDLCA